ncbi:hypothetical protein B1J93_13885 [Leptospira kirschneri serovar Pomona]|uniref:Uncharacterized protein n=1 Tax=Leptospira kirschneri serovar Pomona TaxID=561005 RepID=A0A1T1DJZ5_9LEPT|nr:hypothetical protein B1J93_13885 [Leptospira kirschneri serovar Pomona]
MPVTQDVAGSSPVSSENFLFQNQSTTNINYRTRSFFARAFVATLRERYKCDTSHGWRVS